MLTLKLKYFTILQFQIGRGLSKPQRERGERRKRAGGAGVRGGKGQRRKCGRKFGFPADPGEPPLGLGDPPRVWGHPPPSPPRRPPLPWGGSAPGGGGSPSGRQRAPVPPLPEQATIAPVPAAVAGGCDRRCEASVGSLGLYPPTHPPKKTPTQPHFTFPFSPARHRAGSPRCCV